MSSMLFLFVILLMMMQCVTAQDVGRIINGREVGIRVMFNHGVPSDGEDCDGDGDDEQLFGMIINAIASAHTGSSRRRVEALVDGQAGRGLSFYDSPEYKYCTRGCPVPHPWCFFVAPHCYHQESRRLEENPATHAPSVAAATAAPTDAPTSSPTGAPTTSSPTSAPTKAPVTATPTASPTVASTTAAPTKNPTNAPTGSPTASPTAAATPAPTAKVTAAPTASVTAVPTAAATAAPTVKVTTAPTAAATAAPTPAYTAAPTVAATTAAPTVAPTPGPTAAATTVAPTPGPTASPTEADDTVECSAEVMAIVRKLRAGDMANLSSQCNMLLWLGSLEVECFMVD